MLVATGTCPTAAKRVGRTVISRGDDGRVIDPAIEDAQVMDYRTVLSGQSRSWAFGVGAGALSEQARWRQVASPVHGAD